MTQEKDLNPVPGTFSNTPPHSWAASEVLYRKLTYRYEPASGSKPASTKCYFAKQRNYFWPPPGGSMAGFCQLLAAHPLHSEEARQLTRASNPWDIDVFHPCYIVLHLDPAISWYFRPLNEGAVPKDKTTDYSNRIFGLTHCAFDGTLLPGTPQDNGSKIIFFGIADPLDRDGWSDSLTFCIDQLDPDTGQVMPTDFDPDIKNNGGPPPVPPLLFSDILAML